VAAAADLARDGGEVILPVGPVGLAGTLAVPGGARALVVFAHGGGSGRFSPRNRRVAAWLRQAELGTLRHY
jgi:putative phosphoribosyl transferase